jgi:hypothetical protein
LAGRRGRSRNRDFGEKPDAYAEVGIENHWILELQPGPKLTAFGLEGASYAEIGVSHSLIRLTRPFPVEIDPSQLLSRRST